MGYKVPIRPMSICYSINIDGFWIGKGMILFNVQLILIYFIWVHNLYSFLCPEHTFYLKISIPYLFFFVYFFSNLLVHESCLLVMDFVHFIYRCRSSDSLLFLLFYFSILSMSRFGSFLRWTVLSLIMFIINWSKLAMIFLLLGYYCLKL